MQLAFIGAEVRACDVDWRWVEVGFASHDGNGLIQTLVILWQRRGGRACLLLLVPEVGMSRGLLYVDVIGLYDIVLETDNRTTIHDLRKVF